jgi:hypothetical protein
VTTAIGACGQAVVNGDRLALMREDDSLAFVYELPSLRRVAAAGLAGAQEQTFQTLSLGGPYTCATLLESNDAVALWQGRGSIAQRLQIGAPSVVVDSSGDAQFLSC